MKEKQTIYYCIGLPASGKSFWAKELVARGNGNIKRVNMDLMREMLDNSKWSKEREKFARTIHNQIIEECVKDGYSVVIDNTGFAETHKEWAKELAKKYNCELVERFFDVPLLECIKRDASRGATSVGAEVIYKMYRTYIEKNNPTINNSGDKYFIYDIDGTLAKMTNRGPFEYDKVLSDIVNEPVLITYNALRLRGYKTIIFSGRDGCCEADTKQWLENNNIIYEHFDMRIAGDSRPDTIVKKEMFDRIKNTHHIVGVFDDRNSVCGMWRELGLVVFQCDFGMF